MRAVEAVYENANKISSGQALGGDEFIDIWIFCVIRAKVTNLPRFYFKVSSAS